MIGFSMEECYLIKSLQENKKIMEQNASLKCFLTKYGEWHKRVTERKFEMLMSRESAQLKNGSGWISLSSILPSDNGAVDWGMHESKKQRFWAQTVKTHTLNNCCLLDCIAELNIAAQKHEWLQFAHLCVFVMCWYIDLHCCTELKFTVQFRSYN